MMASVRELHLSGPLTVSVCEALHAEVSAALEQADEILLGVDSDAEIDLTFLQLLIAAERTAAARNKRIALRTPPADALARALIACGFDSAPSVTDLAQIFALQDGRS